MRVADLMTPEVIDCSPDESICVAAHRMNEHHCGCLPVTVCDREDKRLVGIITDRDLTCRAMAQGMDPEKTEVARCMSFPVQTIARDADLGACADLFTASGLRRLVVVDEQNRCQGIISRADLQRFVITQAVNEQPSAPGGPRPIAQLETSMQRESAAWGESAP